MAATPPPPRSANFVEEQQPGVFVKTLRNMWFSVSFFNPLISALGLFVLPMATIYDHPVRRGGGGAASSRDGASRRGSRRTTCSR